MELALPMMTAGVTGTQLEVRSHFTLLSVEHVRYLDDADGLPGEMKAGVEEECEHEGECSVPAQRRHKRATLSQRGETGWSAGSGTQKTQQHTVAELFPEHPSLIKKQKQRK